jgi:hypothetical protein
MRKSRTGAVRALLSLPNKGTNVNRVLLALAATLGSVVGSVGVLAEEKAPDKFEEVFVKEVQADGQAWQFSGVELPPGYTAAITATGTWTINETWDKEVGPGGHAEFKASDSYVKSGAAEGCLLVRVGDTVTAFSKDDETVKITAPGRIHLCANDCATAEGTKKAELFLQGIPLQPAKDAGGSGYQDNSGALKVRLVVRKATKDEKAEK